jgi:photosystem II stability/assembly factor-like uncharacterized protein
VGMAGFQPCWLVCRLRDMRRMWGLLAAAGVLICSVACGTRAPGEAHRSPGTAGSATVATAGPAAARAGSPLAGSFLMDLTWVSDQRGWALAAAPCGRDLCPRLADTTDGGRTWTALPGPPGRVVGPNGTAGCAGGCVSQVRFATATVGYLFGPALFQTSDGGRSWHPVTSRPVEALEPSAGTVIRIVYDHTGCPGPCDRAVQETTAGSAHWHTLFRIPAAAAADGVAAQLVRQGTSVIYIPVYGHVAGGAGLAYTVLFRSTDGGTTWQREADPCSVIGRHEHDTSDLAAAPGGFAAVLCTPRDGTGPTFVRTSADNGSSWRPPRMVPEGTTDHLSLIAAASAAHLVLATGGFDGSGPVAYHLLASADGGLDWSSAVAGTMHLDPRAPAAAFLGFEDATVGRWISGPRDIWTTQDAGQHWHERAFP